VALKLKSRSFLLIWLFFW